MPVGFAFGKLLEEGIKREVRGERLEGSGMRARGGVIQGIMR
jgi:hypothetical protein